jgi:hypothetical protein
VLQVACHQVWLPWEPKQYADPARGVTTGAKTGDSTAFGKNYAIMVAPGARFVRTVTVGRELLPGKYEAIFYQGNNNCPDRVPFDVLLARHALS